MLLGFNPAKGLSERMHISRVTPHEPHAILGRKVKKRYQTFIEDKILLDVNYKSNAITDRLDRKKQCCTLTKLTQYLKTTQEIIIYKEEGVDSIAERQNHEHNHCKSNYRVTLLLPRHSFYSPMPSCCCTLPLLLPF